MRFTRTLVLASTVAFSGLGFSSLRAADDSAKGEAQTVTGVLIDNHCGPEMKNEEEAATHRKQCATKKGCADAGYSVISGTKHLKLDDKGNQLAKEYLAAADNPTHVVVEGTVEGDT